MKKIICLLLALACSFALFACGEDELEVSPEDAFLEVVNNSEPTKITTMSSYSHTATQAVYKGTYTTVFTDDGFVFDYEYQQKALAVPGAVPGSSIETKKGQVIYADGRYSTDGGENWKSELPDTGALKVTLNLKKENLGSFTLSRDGNTLTTVLNAENAKSILGLDIASDAIDVKIYTNGKHLTQLSIAYSTEAAVVSIETSYAYTAIEAD